MNNIFEIAGRYLGEREISGIKHNPVIVDMFAKAGNSGIKDDETAWCAAYVGAVLHDAGLRGTGKLNARSYLNWGKGVAFKDAQEGDIVVLWRESRSSWKGHVAFFVRFEGDNVILRGGNQRDSVSDATYQRHKILDIRRAPEPRTNPTQSTTVRAVAVTATSGASGVAVAVSKLDPTAQYIVLAFCGVALIGLGWILRERLRKWAGGDR
jgi:uncharacterized protein (TIGR02594 family)